MQVRIKHDHVTALGREFGGQVGEMLREVSYLGGTCCVVEMPKPVVAWARVYPDFPRRILIAKDQMELVVS